MGKTLPSVNLRDTKNPTTTQRFIHICKQLEKEKHLDKSKVFEQAIDIIKTEGFVSKPFQQPQKEAKNSSKLVSKSIVKDVDTHQSTVNINEIFKS